MAITLNGSAIPNTVSYAQAVMAKGFEGSVVGKLVTNRPVPMGDSIIPIVGDGFKLGVVGEGGVKPVSKPGITKAMLRPIKVAGIMILSSELVKTNPGNMLDLIEAKLVQAVSEAVDQVVLYGTDPVKGTPIPSQTSVNSTTTRAVMTGTDMVAEIIAGYELVDGDVSGFAFDSKQRTKVALAAQQNNVGLVMPNLAVAADTVAGLPAAYGRTVGAGGAKGFVGDWSKVHWGFASEIELKQSTEATVVDGEGVTHNLWQENKVGYLVETTIAATVLDANGNFAAYDAE